MKKTILFLLSTLTISSIFFLHWDCGKNSPPALTPQTIIIQYPTNTFTPITSPTATPVTGLEVTGSVTLSAGTYDYLYVHMHPNSNIYLVGPSGAVTNAAVTINCQTYFLMENSSNIYGVGTGYAAGSGPGAGGLVGYGSGNDNSMGPTLMGSGGGGAGNGGALLRVNVPNGAATLNGYIYLDGISDNHGGGAGGGLFIQADSITGGGTFTARGGNGGTIASGGGFGGGHGGFSPCAGPTESGGGGGGIIVLSDHSGDFFNGSTNLTGGSAPCGMNGISGIFNLTTF
jgi:hypothetical protein